MALWYAKEPLHLGPVFGYMDYFDGLGIFIDTYQNEATPHNHRHPYISAVVNNGSISYKHDEDGTQGQIGGCHVPLRNLENPTKIAVSYMSNILTVFLDTEGRAQWKPCFRALGVYLPTGYYYGISASTKELSDNHDVISVTTLNLEPDDKEWEDKSDIIPFAENIQVPISKLIFF
ncbi:VIP36-like protein [Stegodyphus dumicola]|uniref:VIP36-like protein n=1 Tax=Stegodyphus dumicola TaxID=202533 RepID=UPI0015ABCB07|nr:VIP36-like protein [Stegodyphus dumicola]